MGSDDRKGKLQTAREHLGKFEREFLLDTGFDALAISVIELEDLLDANISDEIHAIANEVANTYTRMTIDRIQNMLETNSGIPEQTLTRYYEILTEFGRLKTTLYNDVIKLRSDVLWHTLDILFAGMTRKEITREIRHVYNVA